MHRKEVSIDLGALWEQQKTTTWKAGLRKNMTSRSPQTPRSSKGARNTLNNLSHFSRSKSRQKQNVFDEVEEGNPQVAEFRINESYFNEPSEQVI